MVDSDGWLAYLVSDGWLAYRLRIVMIPLKNDINLLDTTTISREVSLN
jgi:hypothetical protein